MSPEPPEPSIRASFGVLTLPILLGSLSFGILGFVLPIYAKQLGASAVEVGGLALTGLASLAFPTLPNIWVLILLWVIEAVGFTLASPTQEALVADLTGDQTRGRAYGLYTFAAGLGATLGPLLGGWLYDAAGHGCRSIPTRSSCCSAPFGF